MRVAALYDIHGNLPALRAVLDEVKGEAVDAIVIGGDVAAGPQPRETIEQLMGLGGRAHFVRGNADREVLDAYDQGRVRWQDQTDPAERAATFAAARITDEHREFLAGFRPTVVLDVDGIGSVLFCHGSPRSDTEIITTRTSTQRLNAILGGVTAALVVGGHTHRQLVHRVGGRRFVNAGSVGAPYEGTPGAFWALIGRDVSLRRTDYDLAAAADELRQTGYPNVDEMLDDSLLAPVDPDQVAVFFEGLAAGRDG